MTHLLLVGNPNCGKTTLFMCLWAIGVKFRVTVEKKTGTFSLDGQGIQITDLPGVYSLTSPGKDSCLDEQITAKALIEVEADLIINLIDACHLERHLYLTSQLLELGKPVIVVLNMMDIAKQRGINIDIDALARQLNCPVIPIQAHRHVNLAELQQALKTIPNQAGALKLNLPETITHSLANLEQDLAKQGINSQFRAYYAYRILEGDKILLPEETINELQLNVINESELDILLADARYKKIHQLVVSIQQKQSDASENFTARLDRIVLPSLFGFTNLFRHDVSYVFICH